MTAAPAAERAKSRNRLGNPWRILARGLAEIMPKGLYARSLIIIIAPVVLLQGVVAFVFMERHWQTVTARLSAAVSRDVAALVDILSTYPQDAGFDAIERISAQRLELSVTVLPPEPLPPPAPKPFFSLLDQTLSREIARRIQLPFWIDTVGNSNLVEIRIQLPNNVLRVVARRNQAYASNSEIFIFWMVGSSLVLLTIAILFLRNQIRPILTLASAAESFGKGRASPDFHPRGAREVRQAGRSFIEMRERIERQIEQRTTMLAGVSHDLRTILTRFRLQLALLEPSPEIGALVKDVEDMQGMLEGYLAFARGDPNEGAEPTDMAELLESIREESGRALKPIETRFSGDPIVPVRSRSFKRAIGNLVANASRHGRTVIVKGDHSEGWLTIAVDDDGPGIPEKERENVFRPFYRLDAARNLDEGGTGLGLAVARDIVRGHGGDITLGESPLGGLRATIRIPA